MKRLLAFMVAGSLIFQGLPGMVTPVLGSGPDTEFVSVSDGGSETDIPAAEQDLSQTTGAGEAAPDFAAQFSDDAGEVPDQVLPEEFPLDADPSEQIPSEDINMAPEEQTGDSSVTDIEITDGDAPADEFSEQEILPEDGSAPSQESVPDDSVIVITGEEDPSQEDEAEIFKIDSSEEIPVFMDAHGQDTVNAAAEKGVLEVEVASGLPFVPEGGLTVTVTVSRTEFSMTDTLHISGPDKSDTARFEGLETAPDYQVNIEAPKYAQYSQTVDVTAGQISKIKVCTARTVTESGAFAGWLRLGDVTGDGQIDEADTGRLLDLIHSGSFDAAANLNEEADGSPKVDIVDLQYVVQNLGRQQLSTIERKAMPQSVSAGEGTQVAGSIENLFSGEGTVSLKPSAGDSVPISEEHPVSLSFELAGEDADTAEIPKIEGMTIQAPVTAAGEDGTTVGNDIASGVVEYTYMDGDSEKVGEIAISQPAAIPKPAMFTAAISSVPLIAKIASGASVTVEPDGSMVLNFGGQIAVKKVTIKITGTTKNQPLVDIAKVEFVNDMADRIPAPRLDIPVLNEPVVGNEEFTISWTPQTNVTGYELYVSGMVKKSNVQETQTIRVSGVTHKVTSINDKSLKNFETYTVKVRSVNGSWTSQYSEPKTAIPKPGALPAPPDNVVATGGYRSVRVTWKDMDDANGYMVYFRTGGGDFLPVVYQFEPDEKGTGKLDTNSYTITGLSDGTSCEVYVIGWNELGWGEQSRTAKTETKSGDTPKLPNFNLINTPNGPGELTSNILTAQCGDHGAAHMAASPLDQTKYSALGVVDNDYASYWTKFDWDDGVAYPVNDFSKGVTVTLNDNYKMNYLTFTATDIRANPERASIAYWEGDTRKTMGAILIHEMDENNNPYYIVKFNEAVTTNKIQLFLGTGYSRIELKIAEMRFHSYDALDDEILQMYGDPMHTTLKDYVDIPYIEGLEARLEAGDQNGEKHPLYKSLKLELETAKKLYLEQDLARTIAVDSRITAKKDGHLGFGGLNAWQPLGLTAVAGEKLIIYVGHNTKDPGENSSLRLIFTQYHAESNCLMRSSGILQVGRNEVTVPVVSTSSDAEQAGQIYIAYEGNDPSDQYGVRISGGVEIPVLNIYRKEGQEKTEAIHDYIVQLEEYVKNLETLHQEQHMDKKNAAHPYDAKNCTLNATDLMMEHMMYSVPATQVWDQLKDKGDKEAQLAASLDAMEKTMKLFYQHKGLSSSAGTEHGNNALPSQHLNIRYMRMFSGAFMYASGNHIGVEWNETACAAGASSWDSFGWGIAHEIGHDINQGTYAIAEITNNYFAQLLTKSYTGTTRFDYKDVYEKVTSGTVGRSSNVAVQLALYWQLHLAFDNSRDDRQMYDDYEEMFSSLFFARVDTYSRNPKKAPKEGLELGKDVDQNLMRLACAAANRNMLPFFERWGMRPDEETIGYAEKYGARDTKALYYVNDDARDYRVDHLNEEAAKAVTGKDVATASVTAEGNQVTVTISPNQPTDVILGYEIIRGMYTDGKLQSEVVGFQPADGSGSATFVETISSIDNRVLRYEVKAVDKYLNYSNAALAGSVKISTGGALDKALWTVETTMVSEDDKQVIAPTKDDPDSGYNANNPQAAGQKFVHSIDRVIDNDQESIYSGTAGESAEIVIDMHKLEEVTSVGYRGSSLDSVSISVSRDGENWTHVKENYTDCTEGDGTMHKIWFDSVLEEHRDDWIGTYDTRLVKFVIHAAGPVSVREIEIYGPSGDNLEFLTSQDGKPAVGILESAYTYADGDGHTIPAGSLIFTGKYKGNPAYNMVLLYDMEGNVIGAKDGETNAVFVIFAKVPENGNLGETSDGTWVYYVEPGNFDKEQIRRLGKVRGELYRVDDAETLQGERVVSDTLELDVSGELPNITIDNRMPV